MKDCDETVRIRLKRSIVMIQKSNPETKPQHPTSLHMIVNQPTSKPVIVRILSGYDAVLSFNNAASFRHTSME